MLCRVSRKRRGARVELDYKNAPYRMYRHLHLDHSLEDPTKVPRRYDLTRSVLVEGT